MNGYLFTAGLTQTQVIRTPGRGGQMIDTLQTWDACASAIIYGGDPEQAQNRFEAWSRSSPEGENPAEVEIKKVVAAQFVDQLLTEAGGEPLDWPQISQRVQDNVQTTIVDDFEQGYWVDINQVLPSGKTWPDIESLKRDLPEDIRSGLNWSPDKQFFFLVSVLTPLPRPEIPTDELESGAPAADSPSNETEAEAKPELDEVIATLPELRDKEAAALVEARNSVVAAWLWRKYAADTRLAANEIQIGPCCSFIPVE